MRISILFMVLFSATNAWSARGFGEAHLGRCNCPQLDQRIDAIEQEVEGIKLTNVATNSQKCDIVSQLNGQISNIKALKNDLLPRCINRITKCAEASSTSGSLTGGSMAISDATNAAEAYTKRMEAVQKRLQEMHRDASGISSNVADGSTSGSCSDDIPGATEKSVVASASPSSRFDGTYSRKDDAPVPEKSPSTAGGHKPAGTETPKDSATGGTSTTPPGGSGSVATSPPIDKSGPVAGAPPKYGGSDTGHPTMAPHKTQQDRASGSTRPPDSGGPISPSVIASADQNGASPQQQQQPKKTGILSAIGGAMKGIGNMMGLNSSDSSEQQGYSGSLAPNQVKATTPGTRQETETPVDRGSGQFESQTADKNSPHAVGSLVGKNSIPSNTAQAAQQAAANHAGMPVYYVSANQASGSMPTTGTQQQAAAPQAMAASAQMGSTASPRSSVPHPCEELQSLACKRWKCLQGSIDCEMPAVTDAKDAKKKKITDIFEGEEAGGGGSAKVVSKDDDENPRGAFVPTKMAAAKKEAPKAEPSRAVAQASSVPAPEQRPVVTPVADDIFAFAKDGQPTVDTNSATPKWVSYLPKFLRDSGLVKAFFRTRGGRQIAGERAQIAHMHGDLFMNVNRAYQVVGGSLHR